MGYNFILIGFDLGRGRHLLSYQQGGLLYSVLYDPGEVLNLLIKQGRESPLTKKVRN